MLLGLFALLACSGGPSIEQAEVVVSWSETEEDFAWDVWARVSSPAALVSVDAEFLPVEGGQPRVLTLEPEEELWTVWGLQEDLGLHCCTTYNVRFTAEDELGQTDEHWTEPLLELPE